MQIVLTVTRGPHLGQVHIFPHHDTFLVGRSAAAHTSFPNDPYFSRFHFLIEVNPPLCRISDLESRNGTLVNDARITAVDLAHGDVIAAGETAFRVTIAEEGNEDPTRNLPSAISPLHETATKPAIVIDTPLIPGYRDLVEIGRGGMGVVYRAKDERSGATVAIKTIRPAVTPSPSAVARFLREADVLRDMKCPQIVAFHASGEANGVLFFAMEFVEGIDASRLIRDRGRLPVPDAVDLACQMCEGLAFAHARGFVHRDIKPANLLLSPDGAKWKLKIADFGLARTYQDSPMSGLSVAGMSAGTPAFMPPEQITDFRNVKPAADQYSAAAAVFNLLTGKFVFEGGTGPEMLRKVLSGDLSCLDKYGAKLPAGLIAVIRKALATKPADRFPDLLAFAAALRKHG